MPSANEKKSGEALNPNRVRRQKVDLERDLKEETRGRGLKGAPGMVKDDRSAGTQGTSRKEPPEPRG